MMPSTSTGKSLDKMDEMTKLIKNLSTKINMLEMDNKNQNRSLQEGNPNQFRCPFVPIFLPRERRNNEIQRERKDNEDQRAQPPFQNNLMNEEEEADELEYEYLGQNINYLEKNHLKDFLLKLIIKILNILMISGIHLPLIFIRQIQKILIF